MDLMRSRNMWFLLDIEVLGLGFMDWLLALLVYSLWCEEVLGRL
jgi:hypothetical protein